MDASTCITFPNRHNKIGVINISIAASIQTIVCFINLQVHEMRMVVKQNYRYLSIEPHKAILSVKEVRAKRW